MLLLSVSWEHIIVKVFIGILLVYSELGLRSLAGNVGVKNTCESPNSGTMYGFFVEDCDGFPCTVRREKRFRADFSFSPIRDNTHLRLKCGTMLGSQPQTLRDQNVCDHLSAGEICPFVGGQNYTYTTTFKIPYWVPPTTYYVSCQMVDDVGASMYCGGGSVRLL